MEFGWSKAQEEVYEGVRRFAERLVSRPGGEPQSVVQWLRACGDLGLLGLSVPEEYGGLGLDAVSSARAMEAFGEGCVDLGVVFACAAHSNACAMPVFEAGSEAVKRRILPRLCSGEWIGANAISESEAGSDLAAIRTRARRDGDDFVIHGEKSWVTNAPIADVFTVYAATNPNDGYLGISAFIVERSTPGIEVGTPFEKIGLHSAQTAPVIFDGCRVPATCLLGAEGRGLSVFNRSMTWERTCLFAGYAGALQRQLNATIAYAKTRRQFRKPIGRSQAVSHRIVDMRIRLEAARLLLYRACWLMDRGEDATEAASMAKLAISEAAVQSGIDSIRVHGGVGVVTESGVPYGLVDALPSIIFSGTSDMQRNLIARELGL